MKLLTEWIKPNGVKIELNDSEASTEHAKKNGWKLYGDTKEGLAEAEEFLAAREARAKAIVAASTNTEAPRRGRPSKEA